MTKFYRIKSLDLETNFETRKYSKHQRIFDQVFAKRVKNYLRNYNNPLVDGNTLVKYLQSKYPEYKRRQFRALKISAGGVIAQLADLSNFDDDDDDVKVKYEDVERNLETLDDSEDDQAVRVVDLDPIDEEVILINNSAHGMRNTARDPETNNNVDLVNSAEYVDHGVYDNGRDALNAPYNHREALNSAYNNARNSLRDSLNAPYNNNNNRDAFNVTYGIRDQLNLQYRPIYMGNNYSSVAGSQTRNLSNTLNNLYMDNSNNYESVSGSRVNGTIQDVYQHYPRPNMMYALYGRTNPNSAQRLVSGAGSGVGIGSVTGSSRTTGLRTRRLWPYYLPAPAKHATTASQAQPTRQNVEQDNDIQEIESDDTVQYDGELEEALRAENAVRANVQEEVVQQTNVEQAQQRNVEEQARQQTTVQEQMRNEMQAQYNERQANINEMSAQRREQQRNELQAQRNEMQVQLNELQAQRNERQERTVTQEIDKFSVVIPNVNFSNVAGCKTALNRINSLIMHMNRPEIITAMNIKPRGILLHGPPGCGKTLIAHAIAGQLQVPLINVPATELVTGISGGTEKQIRVVFEKALTLAPCVIFIDEVDAITSSSSHRDMERRIVSQLKVSIDDLKKDQRGARVLLIGATCRPDNMSPSLRTPGRFDREVCVGMPNADSRQDILKLMCADLRLGPNISLSELANLTPGYVGIDLDALIQESQLIALHRVLEKSGADRMNVLPAPIIDLRNGDVKMNVDADDIKPNANRLAADVAAAETDSFKRMVSFISDKNHPVNPAILNNLFIKRKDFMEALKRIQPSAKREGFATIPNVTWNNIGSLRRIKSELHKALINPINHQKFFEEIGISASMGVLLCGPPGCGKTLLGKAIANEAGINFISVKGPELLNMYVGSSEKAVRDCFHRARSSQPCIIFFDEIDALCPKRADNEVGASTRVVNQLLTEMDGLESRQQVYLMAATNRPDIVDPAIMRPGRFDKVLYVGFPDREGRADILRAIIHKGVNRFATDVDTNEIANNSACEGYTGADLAALVRESISIALTENNDLANRNDFMIRARHFNLALRKIKPSVSEMERARYEAMRVEYGQPYENNPDGGNRDR